MTIMNGMTAYNEKAYNMALEASCNGQTRIAAVSNVQAASLPPHLIEKLR
jgi:hypothetical protein